MLWRSQGTVTASSGLTSGVENDGGRGVLSGDGRDNDFDAEPIPARERRPVERAAARPVQGWDVDVTADAVRLRAVGAPVQDRGALSGHVQDSDVGAGRARVDADQIGAVQAERVLVEPDGDVPQGFGTGPDRDDRDQL